jgi:mersacidin/lichenicidin family type 2 lantibiotic
LAGHDVEKETKMKPIDIIRAWKDEEYRNSLTEAQRCALPESPAGLVELSTAVLEEAAGGRPRPTITQPIRTCMVQCLPPRTKTITIAIA